ncbi:MAG: hypothetical protein IKS98_08055 [Lachnospiraceae bacterium]|nr:hypothetical protein [Lachnospiraceae bacterium]
MNNTISFVCKTNKPYVALNSLNVRLRNGGTVILDRKKTLYEIKDGVLKMEWIDCYVWAMNDEFVFGIQPETIIDGESYPSVARLFAGAKVWFNLEDEADEDYFCEIQEMSVGGVSIELAKEFEPEAYLSYLTPDEKDKIYRALWKEHVVEDAKSQIEEYIFYELIPKEDVERIADQAAERYVYEGDYDCTLSYWDNIENLVKDEISDIAREVMTS